MIAASAALAAIPAGLRDPLISEYKSIVQNFMEHRWLPSELGGGRFSEIVYTILDGHAKGTYASAPKKPAPLKAGALENNGPVTLPPKVTIADGIAVRCAGAITFPLVKKYVDDIVTVDDEEIANAILLLLEKEKTLTEGAGAVATAAVLQHKIGLTGKRVGVFIGGGNIHVSLLSRIIERGLVKDGRLVRLRIN